MFLGLEVFYIYFLPVMHIDSLFILIEVLLVILSSVLAGVF
jgi:hypothetical protein